jgi:DNA-directed RNA polymerase subunit RPC12/RpoP
MSDTPIPIACSECSNQVEHTYEELKASTGLECPACGHQMAAERAAVVRHVQTVRDSIAAVGK